MKLHTRKFGDKYQVLKMCADKLRESCLNGKKVLYITCNEDQERLHTASGLLSQFIAKQTNIVYIPDTNEVIDMIDNHWRKYDKIIVEGHFIDYDKIHKEVDIFSAFIK